MSISLEVRTITPKVAAEILSRGDRNRTISKAKVNTLVRDIKEGRWRVTGQAIQFAKDGSLLDGQHRLTACVKAGKPITVSVAEGLEPDAVMAIDRGRTRSAGDVLAIVHGTVDSTRLAAAIRMCAGFAMQDVSWNLSAEEHSIFLQNHPNIVASVTLVANRSPGVPGSLLAAVHYIGGYVQGHLTEADRFVSVFKSGIPAYPGCPAHLYRERMLRDGVGRISKLQSVCLLVNAWNSFVKGRPVKQLKATESFAMDGWDEIAWGRSIPESVA